MKSNLSKRFYTSLSLITLLSVSLFLNKYTWLILLMVGSIISFHEYNELIKKAFRKKNYLIFFFQITNFLFFITFLIVGYSMYDFPPTR